MTKSTESLRIASSTTTVRLPDEFGFEMQNCYHANELAMWALDTLAADPALKDHPHFDRAVFALHQAKFRFDDLYRQFVEADRA